MENNIIHNEKNRNILKIFIILSLVILPCTLFAIDLSESRVNLSGNLELKIDTSFEEGIYKYSKLTVSEIPARKFFPSIDKIELDEELTSLVVVDRYNTKALILYSKDNRYIYYIMMAGRSTTSIILLMRDKTEKKLNHLSHSEYINIIVSRMTDEFTRNSVFALKD